MAFDNTNRGSIWKNKKKRDKQDADFTGSLNVNGVEYWLNAWKRKEGAEAANESNFRDLRRASQPGSIKLQARQRTVLGAD
jgi:hypothetical protein